MASAFRQYLIVLQFLMCAVLMLSIPKGQYDRIQIIIMKSFIIIQCAKFFFFVGLMSLNKSGLI